jgi:hypothetical protein
LFANSERGFPDFVRWSGIPYERRVKFPLENYDGEIAKLWFKGMRRLSEHKARQHDVGIRFRYEETVLLQIVQLALELIYLILQGSLPVWSRRLGVILGLKLFEPFFPFGNKLAHLVAPLWPPVAGVGLKVCGCTIDIRRPVRVGAVTVHIHVALDQQRFAIRLAILNLKNRVAVKKVVAGDDLLKPRQIAVQRVDFQLVESVIKVRNFRCR